MLHCPISTKRIAIGTLLLVLAVAGCDSKAESFSDAPPSSPVTAPSRVSPPSSSRDAGASASPSPTVKKSQSAKTTKRPKASPKTNAPSGGGTKYPECADGDCKVSFSGSVKFSLRRWTVSASVENGGVRVRLTNPDGMGGGGGFLAGPGCSLAIHADGGGRLGCDKPEDKPEPGGYVVHLLKLNGGSAVIRAILG